MAKKPHPDFPLFLHPTGQWAKKVRGRKVYFGTDPDKALAKWNAQKDDLLAGRTPGAVTDGATVKELVNAFLTAKKVLLDSGELSPITWNHYHATAQLVADVLGKTKPVAALVPADFDGLRAKLAKRLGAVALGNEIQRVRTIFKYGYDAGVVATPVRFGPTFAKPSRRVMRRARHAAGAKTLEASAIRAMLAAAGPQLRAMILLGINCGFGQSDVANLDEKAVKDGWIDFPRPKTGIPRRCPLWEETASAIRAALEVRPKPKEAADAGLVFVTKYGHRWVRVKPRDGKPGVPVDAVQLEFTKLLKACKLKRKGLGFYCLRHSFRTVADGAKDQPAADAIMGHARDDMASVYRERVDDSRLRAVADHVRAWLIE
jgi:integrase